MFNLRPLNKQNSRKFSIALWIVSLMNPCILSNMVTYSGRIRIVSPIQLKKGTTLITPDGIGEVAEILHDFVTKKPCKVYVNLYRGYPKPFRILDTHQYIIYHKPLHQPILLSPTNYRYIYFDKQEIKYRISKRHYAIMTDKSKAEYDYIKTLNKQRYGFKLLRLMSKKNLEIKKKSL